ncbi:MAG: RluA family pseudouridine synthase [Clostridia bacterium]|nr:RluA family pseudouridine synthase [Clostridia bacterium]
MGIKIKFTVDENYDGKLVKDFLRNGKGVSSTLLTRLKLEEQGITSNGCHVRAVDVLHKGDEVLLTLPDDKNEIMPVKLPIKILFEDDHVIAFDKPPFMAVHPVHGHIDDTLANAAAYYAQEKGGNFTFRAINRLDRDTSGVVLAAKNSYSAALLPKSVTKKYVAVCEGIIEKASVVDQPIRLKEGHSIQREVGEGGVHAVTHYCPVRHGALHTLTRFRLETGRTHQIRVHMSYLGHPLAGDDMYGGSLRFINRQALHCEEISFIHPISSENVTVKSPVPKEFFEVLNAV